MPTRCCKGINLSVAAHEVICLIGASGSGKSTLLRCINLLEPIDSGTDQPVRAGDHRPAGRRRTWCAGTIGIVFQSFNLFPHMTVLKNVTLAPTKVLKMPAAQAAEEARALLDRFGLSDKCDDYPDRLSGGQQQRVAIVRALAMQPQIMLLDEVTSALDPELVAEVLEVITELAAAGMTMLIATHEMGFARDIASRVCFLEEGRIIEEAPPAELFTDPKDERTRRFLRRIVEASASDPSPGPAGINPLMSGPVLGYTDSDTRRSGLSGPPNRSRILMRGMDGEPQRPGARSDRFLAHRGLIALCCGTAMAEAFLLIVVAPAARALAPQVSALPPLAIFHDLRWLYSTQRSWLWFGLLFAGLLVARAALNTALVRLAWPAYLTPPPLAALRGALVVTTLTCLLISPLVSLTFGVAILPFSWPFLALLAAMLLIALPLSHAGLAGTWWRTLPPLSAAGWLLAEFAVLSAAAAVSTALPPPDAVPIAGLAGLVNARAWYGLTAAIARAAGQAALTGPGLRWPGRYWPRRARAGPARPGSPRPGWRRNRPGSRRRPSTGCPRGPWRWPRSSPWLSR